MVEAQLSSADPIRQAFHKRYFNIKRKAQRLRKDRGIQAPDKTLDSLVNALTPKNKYPPAPHGGPAEACRRLQRAGKQNKWWRNWTEQEKETAKQLLLYNKGDCDAVWRLMNRVIANDRLAELN